MVKQVKCIQRYYDKKGNINGYIVQDKYGKLETLYPDTVKAQLQQKRDNIITRKSLLSFDFINLTITNDNRVRLLKDKIPSPYCYIESYTIHSFAFEIKDINKKTLIFRSKTDPKKHLAKYKLMNIPIVKYKFYDDYLYLQTQQTVEFVSIKQIRFRNSNLRENMGLKADGFFSGLKFRIIDISQVDTVEMTDMSAMFQYCTAITLNLSNINTSNVIDMSSMFCDFGVSDTVIDLSKFNTSKVKDFNFMFAYYQGKQGIDLSVFDTKNVEDFYGMFIRCQAESINLRGWDFSKAKDKEDIFQECNSKVIQ